MNKHNSLRLLLIIFVTIVCSSLSYSQGFKVKEFKQNLNDGSAFHAPMDVEGHPCGLIKVRTDNSELHFKGKIVGDVENKMNEYWVFVAQGCKFLNVFHPNLLPLVVPFSDYGIEITSKATYILTLEETKYKKEKTGVTIVVKPEDADLYIDNIFIANFNGNSLYQLYLPKGEHVCKFSKAGYRPDVQVVQTGKASQNISVELESVMAELEVKCKTATAEIYIDGDLKGNGTWKGNLLAGEHKIEARQLNFNTHIQTVTLAEKERRAFTIPELKRSMGKLYVETEPSNMPIMVDGNSVGVSPLMIDVESGKHYVSCKSYGCVTERSDVEINSGETKTVSLKIKYENNNLKEDYQKAYCGNVNSILSIISYKCRKEDYEEAFFWVDRHPDKEKVIFHWDDWRCDWIHAFSYIGKPEKALELYPIAKANEESRGGLFSSDLEMMYIGEGFFKKKEYDKAISCYEKAESYGLEGLGDCYVAKGDKQRAATFYKKCLSLDYYDGKKRVENKLRGIEY